MAYNRINVSTNLKTLKAPIEDAKTKGTYAGQEANWDQQVVAILQTDCGLANQYVQDNANNAKSKRDHCKTKVDAIETMLKQKTLAPNDIKNITLQVGVIERFAEEIHQDNRELNAALVPEYRAGWPEIAKGLLHNKALAQPFIDARNKEIDVGKDVAGNVKRADEFVIRAKEYLKQAIQRSKDGAVDVAEFQTDWAEIKTKMEAGKAKIDLLAQKAASHVTKFEGWDKLKTWTPVDKKTADSLIGQVAAGAKEARGQMKTLTILLDGLEKRGKAAGPGHKEAALKAVKTAKDTHAAAQKAADAFTKTEEKCNKILAKMKK